MLRTIVSAALASAALLAASGVSAEPAGPYYTATPVAAPQKAKLMTRDTPWALRDGVYVAAQAPMRDTALCQLIARDVGGLSSFTVGGQAYDAAQLDACNTKAGVKVNIARTGAAAAGTN